MGGIAHRVEDLIGRLRDGELQPSPSIVDICLESVDVLKKTLHRQWTDEAEMREGVDCCSAKSPLWRRRKSRRKRPSLKRKKPPRKFPPTRRREGPP